MGNFSKKKFQKKKIFIFIILKKILSLPPNSKLLKKYI